MRAFLLCVRDFLSDVLVMMIQSSWLCFHALLKACLLPLQHDSPQPPTHAATYMHEVQQQSLFRAGDSTASANTHSVITTAAALNSTSQQQQQQQQQERDGERNAKRRRWAQEQRKAMGSPLALAAASASRGGAAVDLLSFKATGSVNGSSEQQAIGEVLTSVDGAVVAGQLGGANLEMQSAGPMVQQQRLAWACACPLTANGWARAAM